MFSILIKKEYRVKFKFTNFLYNDLWSLCESYFELVDESPENLEDSTELVNAMVASYNIVLYCGKTIINADHKEDVKGFVKHQISTTNPSNEKVLKLLDPQKNESILSQLFNVTDQFLREMEIEDVVSKFTKLREKVDKEMKALQMKLA